MGTACRAPTVERYKNMQIDDLLKGKSEWLKGEGPRSNIAISTRVRLARNIKGHLYFNRASDINREETLEAILRALEGSAFFKNSLFIRIKETSEIDRGFLIERHLMSKEHAHDVEQKGLVVEGKEILSAMINEEDHIRFQVMQSGFNVMEAWRIIDEVDDEVGKLIPFDYSNIFGYLTSCPTNTGTGLRASVMLHLSALVMTDQIDTVYKAISKLGLTMRGFYGEGTEALGDFFQISNQVALGHSEMDILDNLERIIGKIITREEATRKNLMMKSKQEISDRIFRSYGTLKSARIITSNETVKLLSAIRLGADLGLIDNVDTNRINEVLLMVQPAHLQKSSGKTIPPYERDIKRADMIRKILGVEGK
ncbi:MAG: protein arginine kinase [Candidatus Omnitrophica bacterium]|nr:protein arginine kinase [Candidatus Omnitrophota bacterium]